jgi:hypothetical protein
MQMIGYHSHAVICSTRLLNNRLVLTGVYVSRSLICGSELWRLNLNLLYCIVLLNTDPRRHGPNNVD